MIGMMMNLLEMECSIAWLMVPKTPGGSWKDRVMVEVVVA